MKSQFFNKGGFNKIYTNDKSNNYGFVKIFMNTKSNKARFAKNPEFFQISIPISPTKFIKKRMEQKQR